MATSPVPVVSSTQSSGYQPPFGSTTQQRMWPQSFPRSNAHLQLWDQSTDQCRPVNTSYTGLQVEYRPATPDQRFSTDKYTPATPDPRLSTDQLHWTRGQVETSTDQLHKRGSVQTSTDQLHKTRGSVQTSTDQQAPDKRLSTFFAEAKLCTKQPTRQEKGSTAREKDKVN